MSNYQELLKQNNNFIKKIDEINKNIINLKDKNDYKKIIKQIEKLEEEIKTKKKKQQNLLTFSMNVMMKKIQQQFQQMIYYY